MPSKDVRNPMNPHQVSRIDLSPEVIDCIVFWTKNPESMLDRLEELSAYQYYFQFALRDLMTKSQTKKMISLKDAQMSVLDF